MSGGTQSFHLLLESVGPGSEKERIAPRGAAETISIDPLVIQSGVNYLVQEKGKRPRLVSRAPKKKEGLFALQQVTQNNMPRLLLLSPADRHILLNGNVAPSITLLADKDEVQFGRHGELLVHVAVFNRIYIGPPPAQAVGRDCKFCRTPFLPESRVYTCHVCGKSLHLEGDEEPEQERLLCATLCSTCPTCEAPILEKSGYRSLPEFCNPQSDRSGT